MNSEYWLPHLHCVLGDPWIVGWSVAGNVITGIAYILIPLLLWKHVHRLRGRLLWPEIWLLGHGGLFIFLCALTHFMAAWNWYHANYFGETFVVAATGIVSITFWWRLFWFIRNLFTASSSDADKK